ncbi:hypothetical protein BH11MYX3_BH11MYX3_06820 [soil metagenome]
MTVAALLRTVADTLDAARIPYMVVGSFASSFHGEPRTTQDLDVVIDPDPPALEILLSSLPARFYVDADVARDALARRGMFNVIDPDTGWKIDLIIRKARPFSVAELARREKATIAGVDVFIASAEDTVVAKLEWAKQGGSARQLDDVRRLLRIQLGTLDQAYVVQWVRALGLDAEWADASAD